MPETDLHRALDLYVEELRLRPRHTRVAYLRDVRQFTAYCLQAGLTAWSEVDTQHLRTFIAARHRDGIAPRSLQRCLAALRGFGDFLQTQGWIKRNPALGLRAPKTVRRLPEVLDTEQSARLVEIDPAGFLGSRDRALLELLYSSGLRVAELVGLQLTDVDFASAEVRVHGKGDKVRIVPVGRHALAALRAWLQERQALTGIEQVALFVNRRGQRLSTRAVQLRCAHWGIKQGIAVHVHPHMLRHSFASHVLESSGDLRGVQELLGHADIHTTQVYTHLDFQYLAKVYDAAHPRARRKGRDPERED